MKTILVTGAEGFIGSNLILLLAQKGYQIVGLSYKTNSRRTTKYKNIDLRDNVKIVKGDIKSSKFCDKICKGIDVIYHLAALADEPTSYLEPENYIDTNIKGTLNICRAALKNNVNRIIQVSSSAVYGNPQYLPVDENHPIQTKSPYSASKIGADAIAMSFFYSSKLPLTIARPFNTYGPMQNNNAVIPSFIKQIISGKKIISVGDLNPRRDFTFVVDVCQAIIALSKSHKAMGEVVNIGTNIDTSIKDVLSIIKKIMKSDVKYVIDKKLVRPLGSKISPICCDNSKLKKLTGFYPKTSLEKGLKITINTFTNC